VEETSVTDEEEANLRSGQGDKGVGVGEEKCIAVEMKRARGGISGALRGGDGESRVPALLQGLGSAGRRGEDRMDSRDLVGELEKTGSGIGRRDLEIRGDLLWDAVRPETVMINVGEEIVDFRRETGVGRIGRGGVIFTLKRIPKEDDGGERGVGGDR
jgi:hypothetical protein